MHELSITDSILDVVVKHAEENNVSRVVSVTLQIGELSDIVNEWMQHYFDYLSKGTVVEGAKLKIERIPIRIACGNCNGEFETIREAMMNMICPYCNGEENFSIIAGRGYFIKEMEAI